MSSAVELAILLSAKDAASKVFEGVTANAGKMGGALALGAGGAATAVGLIGKAAFDVASDIRGAQNTIQVQLGATADEAKALGKVATDVFRNNFAGSIQEAGAAVAEAKKALGGLGQDVDLQGVAQHAFRIRDAFGVEVADSIGTVKTLMQNFGLTSDQAFDFITSGMQQGLNQSGDFLESITEYATQFSNGGATASQFFSIMQTGLGSGVIGTDKAADAFKEFQVRILDGSKLTSESLAMLGLNAEEITGKLADGSMTTAQAFDLVLGALKETDDQAVLMQAGVGLIGTQFEDLGASAVLAIDTAKTSIDSLSGSTKGLDAQYNTLGSSVEGFKRQALVALAPLGDKMIDLANVTMPHVATAAAATAAGIEASFGQTEAFFAEHGPAIMAGLTAGMEAAKPIVEDVMGFVREQAGFVVAFFREEWPQIQEAIDNLVKLGMALWRQFGDEIFTIAKITFDQVKLVVETAVKVVLHTLGLIVALINGDWSDAWHHASEIVDAVMGLVKGTIENNIKIAVTILAGLGAAAKDAVGDLAGVLVDAGKALIQGLIDGITGKLGDLKNKLGEVTDLIPDWKGPIDRDRNLLFDSGVAIMAGLIDGIVSQVPELEGTLQAITDGAHQAAQGAAVAGSAGAAGGASAGSSSPFATHADAIANAPWGGPTDWAGAVNPLGALFGPGAGVFVDPNVMRSQWFYNPAVQDEIRRQRAAAGADRARDQQRVTINITGPVYGMEDFREKVADAWKRTRRAGGFNGLIPEAGEV